MRPNAQDRVLWQDVLYAARVIARPTSILTGVLSVCAVFLSLSVLGFDVSLSGGKIVLLSRTAALGAAEFEQPVAAEDEPEEAGVDVLALLDGSIAQGLPADLPVERSAYASDNGQWRTVRMRVTAYCPCRRCCGRHAHGVTANGYRIQSGDVLVAADKKIRFGTEVMVPGYNDAQPVKVMDRGRLIKGNRLDVYFDSHTTAKQWGTRYLDVLVRTR